MTRKSQRRTTNDMPESLWPIKKGTKVYFFQTGQLAKKPLFELRRGTVRHYNPALVGSCLTTEGRPTYTIDEDDAATCDIVSAGKVFASDGTVEASSLAERALGAAMVAEANRLFQWADNLRIRGNELIGQAIEKGHAADAVGEVRMMAKKIRGKRYAAGDCVVNLFGASICAVAVIAGDLKWVSTEEDCIEFLSKRGLTKAEAKRLIHEARKARKETEKVP